MKKALTAAIFAVLLVGLTAFSFAWLMPAGATFPQSSATLSADYFAGGTGTKEDPYQINAPVHLYNLSWLQNKGVFAGENFYFKLTGNVDMDSADSSISGAIPPIGSTENPFSGYFDGGGYTISNLWISSDPNDWAQKPDSYDAASVGKDIGMFGKISKSDTGVTYAGNFYLENVEVTTNVTASDGSVGLIAGYVDGSLSKVGVINGKITAKNGSVPVSDFTLVGKTDSAVDWTDAPGALGGGGNLVIQPNTTSGDYNIGEAFTGNTLNGDTVAVPGSLSGTAYFKKTVTLGSVNGGLKSIYMYGSTVSYPASGNSTINESSGSWTTTAPGSDEKEKSDFYSYYSTYKSSARVLSFGGKSNVANGVSIESLTNCVWFKPQAAGKCALVFVHQNQSSTNYMSLYRFVRDGDDKVSGLQELQFQLSTAHGNKNVNYYEIQLSAADLNYEYVIAVGSSNDNGNFAQFFYMMLAGADKSTGSASLGTGKVLEQIDFLSASPSDFTQMHLPVLSINSGTTAAVNTSLQSFYFAVFADGLVHYYTDGNVVVSETVLSSAGSNGTKESSAAGFPAINNTPA